MVTRSSLLTALAVGLVTLAVAGLPLERSGSVSAMVDFLLPFLATVAIFAIITIGLNVQWGYTGILNFGVMGFFLVGAYTAAIFTKSPATSEYVQYVGGFGDSLAFLPFLDSREWLPHIVGALAAGAACAVLALLLAIPTLRLREDYLAIATIGVAEVLRRIVIEERSLVNGSRGLTGIPRPLSGWFEPEEYRWAFLGICLLVLLLVYLLVEMGLRSPWGRVLRALREDEDATAASGKNVAYFKMQAFVLGAFIMGVGGALYAYQYGSLSPETFTHFFGTFIIWTMLMVGGSGNNLGAIAGAYVVWGFWSATLQLQGYDLPPVVETRLPFVRDLLLGTLIVAVLLFRPQGLLPERARVSRWLERRVRQLRKEEAQRRRALAPESTAAE
ncbi:MAG TPA: branched-chain amino acid ABC transporter permease [Dehalococcoidia bacterium]